MLQRRLQLWNAAESLQAALKCCDSIFWILPQTSAHLAHLHHWCLTQNITLSSPELSLPREKYHNFCSVNIFEGSINSTNLGLLFKIPAMPGRQSSGYWAQFNQHHPPTCTKVVLFCTLGNFKQHHPPTCTKVVIFTLGYFLPESSPKHAHRLYCFVI